MSRRLGALTLALGLLVCSMGLKAALSSGHSNGSVTQLLNGPDPVPPAHFKGPVTRTNGPDPVPPAHFKAPVLQANGPDPVPPAHFKGSVTRTNGPDPVPPAHFKAPVLQANGPDPVPPYPKRKPKPQSSS